MNLEIPSLGNNNPYCHDDEVSWLDWSLLDKNWDIFRFFPVYDSFQEGASGSAVQYKRWVWRASRYQFSRYKSDGLRMFSSYDRYIGVMMAGQIEGRRRRLSISPAMRIGNSWMWCFLSFRRAWRGHWRSVPGRMTAGKESLWKALL